MLNENEFVLGKIHNIGESIWSLHLSSFINYHLQSINYIEVK